MMLQRLLALLLLVVGGLIAIDVVARSRTAAEVSDRTVASIVDPDNDEPRRRAAIEILPGATAPPAGAPSIEMQARLAIRRRIEREGARVYLDSLLAATDSTLVRWPDRPDRMFTVGYYADTAVVGWDSTAINDVRAALRGWDSNEANIRLREIRDSSVADIKVQWVHFLDTAQTGITQLTWSPDGRIQGATITLGLRQGRDTVVIPAWGRRRVALHEIGHALGLPHSTREGDAMFPSSPQSSPSRRDQATLLLLYAVPHGPLRLP